MHAAGDRGLRVLTLNLHCWQEVDAEAKLMRIAEAIAIHEPDLICFQEVGQHVDAPIIGERHGATIRADNAALVVAQELERSHGITVDWAWAFAHLGFGVWEEGVAVMARGVISHVDAPFVSKVATPLAWNARRLLIADVVLPGIGGIAAASAHFSWWDDPDEPFAPQWERAEIALAPHASPAVLAGDFNVLDGSQGYEHMMRSGVWSDAHAALSDPAPGTFPGDIAGWSGASAGRIDYVLSRGGQLVPRKAQLLFDSEGIRVSDHFGLLIEFDVRPT